MSSPGRTLITAGLILIVTGIIVSLFPRLPMLLGRLPGDIHINRDNFSFHFPVATCLLASALLSLIFWLFRH